MTTLAIIAGMLPVALGKGDGSASRASLATVVVGGQAMCLLVTLLITPVIYSTFDDMRGLRLVAGIRFPRWKSALTGRLAWGPPPSSPPGARERLPESGR
jgi:HAE1 family hydrophobic/amphiphilic exporter-1